jgi:hypothetical protein
LLPGHAGRVAARVSKQERLDLRHYMCLHCGYYHVGSMDMYR